MDMVCTTPRAAVVALLRSGFSCSQCNTAYRTDPANDEHKVRVIGDRLFFKLMVGSDSYCLPCAEIFLGRKLTDADFSISDGLPITDTHERVNSPSAYAGWNAAEMMVAEERRIIHAS